MEASSSTASSTSCDESHNIPDHTIVILQIIGKNDDNEANDIHMKEIRTCYGLIKSSTTIMNMLEDVKNSGGKNSEPLGFECPIKCPLFFPITYEVMNKIIELCQYHFENPIKHKTKKVKVDTFDKINKMNNKELSLSPFDLKYCQSMTIPQIVDVINTLDFLGMKDYLKIMMMYMAMEINKCKTTEEIREKFEIKNDFTPDEEAIVKKEGAWVDE